MPFNTGAYCLGGEKNLLKFLLDNGLYIIDCTSGWRAFQGKIHALKCAPLRCVGQLGSPLDVMPYLDLSVSLFKFSNMPVSWSVLQHGPVLEAISKELWGIVFMVILVHSVVIQRHTSSD